MRSICDCTVTFYVGDIDSDSPSQEELSPLVAQKMREALATYDRTGSFDFEIEYQLSDAVEGDEQDPNGDVIRQIDKTIYQALDTYNRTGVLDIPEKLIELARQLKEPAPPYDEQDPNVEPQGYIDWA